MISRVNALLRTVSLITFPSTRQQELLSWDRGRAEEYGEEFLDDGLLIQVSLSATEAGRAGNSGKLRNRYGMREST